MGCNEIEIVEDLMLIYGENDSLRNVLIYLKEKEELMNEEGE